MMTLPAKQELHEVPAEPHNMARDYPRNHCLHELFEHQVRHNPEAVALICGEQQMTYGELNARANQVAHYLVKRGAGPEVLVGICVERDAEMLVGILGILKAGSAYVPLDRRYPAERLGYILEDAKARMVVAVKSVREALPGFSGHAIWLDEDWPEIAQESRKDLCGRARSDHLAYVLFTSGSTGRPKGVALEHRSAVTFVQWSGEVFTREELDGVLLSTSICFDLSVFEIFATLSAGGTVIIAENVLYLQTLPARDRVTLINTVPSAMTELVGMGGVPASVRTVNLAGEALAETLVEEIYSNTGVEKVYNLYGPTEDTTYSTFTLVPRGSRVSIGRPIANTQAYILDAQLNGLSIGASGELYLAGEGLARGYYGRPDLTAERFLPDPFGSELEARMYRTSDVCRWLPDGDIQYLGRADSQVKIRGFRIELGEVEAVLRQHPSVRQAVAVARQEATAEKALVAYYVAAAAPETTTADLREHLRRHVPEYMIPSAFVRLDQFPLTPNGKVDRKALPAPTLADYKAHTEYAAPRDEVERRLVALWEKILDVHPVGTRDNFFDLGGTSLRAARLFMGIARTFGKELPLSTLVHAPTLELLANEIRPAARRTRYPTLVAMGKGGSKPPLFVVHGGAGTTLFLQRLAAKISDRPFYGIEPDGLDGRRFRYQTIEQMATYYLSEIRRVQPTGVYHLGGYCFGGLVAFEMAQQLLRQGEKVGAIMMFTAPLARNPGSPAAPAAQTESSRRRFGQRLGRLAFSPWSTLRKRWSVLRRILAFRLLPALGWRIPQGMRREYVVRTLRRAEEHYVPAFYPGTLIFFRGSNLTEFGPSLGWDGLAARLEHRIIGSGDYQDRRQLFDEPLVARTARELEACLDLGSDADGVSAPQQAPPG